MAVSQRRSGGFTLVELLVVVVIIGMLVGLLMPAILNSRKSARLVTCINHLKEINKATILYHESKKRLPGAILTNQKGKPNWSWVVQILDPLGRTDLWETWRSEPSPGPLNPPLVNTLVCTDDTDARTVLPADTQAALSYVANNYFFRERQYNSTTGMPLPTTRTVSLTDVKSPSITILFSERLNKMPPNNTYNPSPWAPATTEARLTFPGQSSNWRPPSNGVVPETPLETMANAGISSGHAGVVVVAKADDAVEAISTRADMSIYIKAQVGIPTP